MSLPRCFECGRAVLELEGQFAQFSPYLLTDADDEARAAHAYGHVHLACLKGSRWGAFWFERRKRQLAEVQQLPVAHEGEALIIFDEPAMRSRIALGADGMVWTYPVGKKAGRAVSGGKCFAVDEELNLELGDQDLAARLREELKSTGRTSLLALADRVGSRGDLVYAEHLADAHLAYDRTLSPVASADWVSGRARYDRFVPDHVLRASD